PANNGLHVVSSAAAAALVVSSALVDETPSATATLTKVGHQYASADITVDASGARPALVTAAGDFRELDLVPGESVYVGGDLAAEQLADAANNGCKRVYSATQTTLTLDKSELDMITDASGTGKTVRIFTGFALKNEQGSSFFRQFLQFERTLGAPDDAQPTQIQSEYVTGAIASEYTLELPAAGKATASQTYMGQGYETRTGATGVKAGTRPDLPQLDAINTSSDVCRFRVARLSGASDEAPAPLFALIQSCSLTINNSINRGTALGVVGAARFTVGRFACTGNFDA